MGRTELFWVATAALVASWPSVAAASPIPNKVREGNQPVVSTVASPGWIILLTDTPTHSAGEFGEENHIVGLLEVRLPTLTGAMVPADLQSATSDLLPLDDDLGLGGQPPNPPTPPGSLPGGPIVPPSVPAGSGGTGPGMLVVPLPTPGLMVVGGLSVLAMWRRRRI